MAGISSPRSQYVTILYFQADLAARSNSSRFNDSARRVWVSAKSPETPVWDMARSVGLESH
jgi:hypothetical protein